MAKEILCSRYGSARQPRDGRPKKKRGRLPFGPAAVLMVLFVLLLSACGGSDTAGTASGNVMMADGDDSEDDTLVLGSSYARSDILTVTFLDSISESDTAWDVSEAGDGSVMAWVEANGDGYDLYIGGDGGVVLSSGLDLFEYYTAVTEINFNGCVDTGSVVSFYGMFFGCESLTSLDVSGFDTSSAENMAWMFGACSSLTELDLSGFDTSNVTDMDAMFYYCASLTGLDLSGFDTSKVTDMGYMFGYCESLTSLDVSGFDTSAVTSMVCMFQACGSLTGLDLSGFAVSEDTFTDDMFADASVTAEEAGLTVGETSSDSDSDSDSDADSSAYVVSVITGTEGGSGESYENLFDGDAETKWCVTDFESFAFVGFEMSEAITVSAVRITTAADHSSYPERSPVTWYLYGMASEEDIEDAESWVMLASTTGASLIVTEAEDCKSYDYTIGEMTKTAYQYFVFLVTEVESGNVMQFSELELVG